MLLIPFAVVLALFFIPSPLNKNEQLPDPNLKEVANPNPLDLLRQEIEGLDDAQLGKRIASNLQKVRAIFERGVQFPEIHPHERGEVWSPQCLYCFSGKVVETVEMILPQGAQTQSAPLQRQGFVGMNELAFMLEWILHRDQNALLWIDQ